ncbi:hypothetical protein BJ875DRAFT_260561 [Amylocarpus encephaloides]|uniref:Zn(2)-C6 fungal-type domain-containing protein n=1 Tax=Amylocarpus encephaloides TaxID=45428 RepID=A0A9P7YM32_9HELO|nr:hypothetical protein BJ875DRAFT_260561 [Amylocarpus encephaloides]
MSEREPALDITHVAPEPLLPRQCSLCERRKRACTLLKISPRCLACVESDAVCSFTMPSKGEWDKLNRAEEKLEQELVVVGTWLKAEVSNLQRRLAQIAAARLLQPLDITKATEAFAQLLQEENTAYELMVTMLGRRARLSKQQEFLRVRGEEMLHRGMAVLDEEDAMDWEENGGQEEDKEAAIDEGQEDDTKSFSDTKSKNDSTDRIGRNS